MEGQKLEANRLINQFEKIAKEAASGPAVINKVTRLTDKFEKKAAGIEEPKAGGGAAVSSIKKVFEPTAGGPEAEVEKAADVISAGATNRLIGRFQEATTDC